MHMPNFMFKSRALGPARPGLTLVCLPAAMLPLGVWGSICQTFSLSQGSSRIALCLTLVPAFEASPAIDLACPCRLLGPQPILTPTTTVCSCCPCFPSLPSFPAFLNPS